MIERCQGQFSVDLLILYLKFQKRFQRPSELDSDSSVENPFLSDSGSSYVPDSDSQASNDGHPPSSHQVRIILG